MALFVAIGCKPPLALAGAFALTGSKPVLNCGGLFMLLFAAGL